MSCCFVQENPFQLGRGGREAWSGLGGGCEAKAGWGDWGRHGGGMPGRGRGSRIQAPPNDRPPTIRKLWPGLMTLPTKQWSLTRVWRFPTTHPSNKPTNHICWTIISSSPGSSPTNETKLTKKWNFFSPRSFSCLGLLVLWLLLLCLKVRDNKVDKGRNEVHHKIGKKNGKQCSCIGP